MAINDFKTFATSSTANVYTTAEYLADTDRSNGNQPGIAKSKLVNKALRQSSVISTVVAQLISDLSGADALDDGTTDTLLNNLKAIFNAKAPSISPTFTGTVGLPASTSIGNVSSVEIGYLDGTTSAIQTQLNAKAPSISPTFTGTVGLPASTSIGNVSSVEIGYLDGTTSAIQTQLNAKVSSASPTFTGTPTAPTAPVGTNTTQLATTSFVKSEISSMFNVSGSAPMYACRAWVNFNGTGTVAIRASGNVSSITDNGVGYYTVNFTTAMPDANYAVNTTTGGTSNAYWFRTAEDAISKTASRIAIKCIDVNFNAIDPAYVSIVAFR